jgi:hypothetical protein
MTTNGFELEFQALEAMDAPSDGMDWATGFTIGVGLGLIALSVT